ncbi:MAG TPA: FAD-dependent oxidoreductase [Burkholderiales bacterium]|nr:FAD-dependent oxidoreductase [Burkholderiales bacterium]
MRRLVLAGAGHAHAVALRAFAAKRPGGRIVLVAPEASVLYSGMLPGVAAGHYRPDECRIDFARLARAAGAEFIGDAVLGLDAVSRTLRLASGNHLTYDLLSLNVGSAVAAPPGALTVKPFAAFLDAVRHAPRVAVVGAGTAGVEIAMALRHRGAQVTLSTDRFPFDGRVARRISAALERSGVEFRIGPPGEGVQVWASGARAYPWLKDSGLSTDAAGFVLVDATLRSVAHPEVFAAGDCATLRTAPHAKSGVYSVRHGAVLAGNLSGGFRTYVPQPRQLALITCGARYAIASWGAFSAEGAWAWRWKDRIDRRWVAGFASAG